MIYDLSELGLNHAIHTLTHIIGLGSSIQFQIYLEEQLEQGLTANQKLHIYKIVQEAITNIMKHAQATDVKIYLAQKDKQGILLVKDIGKGFHLNQLKNGIGITSITHRIKLLKGYFNIATQTNQGTTLEIYFPV